MATTSTSPLPCTECVCHAECVISLIMTSRNNRELVTARVCVGTCETEREREREGEREREREGGREGGRERERERVSLPHCTIYHILDVVFSLITYYTIRVLAYILYVYIYIYITLESYYNNNLRLI